MAILPVSLARVSNQLRSSITTSQINSTEAQLADIEQQLSTGKQINLPSDNPTNAAVVEQISKTIEQRQAYTANLNYAKTTLSETDTSLGNLSDLLDSAKITASANVGSDVSADDRKGAAATVDALYNQLLSISNDQLNGTYLYSGDSTTQAFTNINGSVVYTGGQSPISNAVDDKTETPLTASGTNVFNSLSKVAGTTNLTPTVSANTRLTDLNGATRAGVTLGAIQVSDGTVSQVVDLSACKSVGDVVTAINNAAIGGVTAAVSTDGSGITLSGTPTENIAINEVNNGATAETLGLNSPTGAGAGNDLVGSAVNPKVTEFTDLSALNDGAGIDQSGLTITNGTVTKNLSFSACQTVEDLMNVVNGAGLNLKAQINSDGTGINIVNLSQNTNLSIAENGGGTAADLGVQSFTAATPLVSLNGGKGVSNVAGDDLTLTDSNGVSFGVDIDGATTVQNVIDKINSASTTAGAAIAASFSTTTNSIVVTCTGGGANPPTIVNANSSTAVNDLGLSGSAVGNAITGTDVNPIEPDSIFTHIAALSSALKGNDQQAITAAAGKLAEDYERVVTSRGVNGANLKAVESRANRIDDQNLASKTWMSSLQDVDYTSAITQFTTLQTALQATMQTAGHLLNMSLLDFLG